MENWNDVSKQLSEAMSVFAKRAGEIGSEITNMMNNFVKSEEFRKFEEIISNIPDDVQKTNFFQKCQKMGKVDLTYEEVKLLFDEFEICNMEEAREKKRRETAGAMLKSELITSNHGMESENIYKTVLLAIRNVVFANTDEFTRIDKRLPFRNNILHRGIIDYSDEEVNIAYETLLIFVAHVIDMNVCFQRVR